MAMRSCRTQIGRGVAIYYDPPEGTRRKRLVKHGLLMGVKDGHIVVQVHGEEYPVYEPAFGAQTSADGSVWWEFRGPQRPVDAT